MVARTQATFETYDLRLTATAIFVGYDLTVKRLLAPMLAPHAALVPGDVLIPPELADPDTWASWPSSVGSVEGLPGQFVLFREGD